MISIDALLGRLHGVQQAGAGYRARCPAHQDKNPSLSIGIGDDGRILLHCFVGCSVKKIVASLGIELRDLMPDSAVRVVPKAKKPTIYPTPQAAAAETATWLKVKNVGEWVYQDKAGTDVLWIYRFEPEGGGDKTFRPVSRCDGGYRLGDPDGLLALYRLPELVNAPGTVFVVEGEKCADAVMQLGFAATTSAHGSQSAAKTDWRPLAGKNVVMPPDNDDPGRKYGAEVTETLLRLEPPATIRIVALPGLGPSEDVVDWIAARRAEGLATEEIAKQLVALADQQVPVKAAGSGPNGVNGVGGVSVDTTTPKAEPFPIDALPRACRLLVSLGAKAQGVDAAFWGVPMLGALAGSIGNAYRLQIKTQYFEPPVLWAASVGPSGSGKSPPLDVILAPMRERDRELLEESNRAWKDYEQELENWRHPAQKGPKGPKPEPPPRLAAVVEDITIEGLAVRLQDNPRGLLLAVDELAGWVGGFDAYRKGRGSDVTKWLTIHRAGSIKVDRKTTDKPTVFVKRAAVSVVGTIQPGVLRRVVQHEHQENGLAARLLLCRPPVRMVVWSERDIPKAVVDDYWSVVMKLLRLPAGEPPAALHLTVDARAAWIDYHNEVGREMAAAGDDGFSAVLSKLKGCALRIALVLAVAQAAEDDAHEIIRKVDKTAMERGIKLARYFIGQARAIYAEWRIEEGEPKSLVQLIDRRGGSVTVRTLMRETRRFARSRDARLALDDLVARGAGTWKHKEAANGHIVDTFVLNADAADADTISDEVPAAPQGADAADADTISAGDDDPAPQPAVPETSYDSALNSRNGVSVNGVDGQSAVPDTPPPIMTHRPCSGRRWWRIGRGPWVCAWCHPPTPGIEVEFGDGPEPDPSDPPRPESTTTPDPADTEGIRRTAGLDLPGLHALVAEIVESITPVDAVHAARFKGHVDRLLANDLHAARLAIAAAWTAVASCELPIVPEQEGGDHA